MLVKLLGIEAGRGGATPGTQDGPWTLRERGLVGRIEALGHTVEDLGDIPGVHETRFPSALMGINHLPNVVQVNRHTHACVLGTRRKAPEGFLLIIGGDHSLAIGTLAGLSDACRRLGVLWIDAHADFNTPGSSPSGNAHGMSLAVACGRGAGALRAIADRDPMVDEADVFLYGCRALDRGEQAALARSRVNTLTTAEWRQRGLVQSTRAAAMRLRAQCDHVHLSFDFDVLDPAVAPGCGIAVPGGLQAEEAAALLGGLVHDGLVQSAEFVEYNPDQDPDGRSADVALQMIAAVLRGTPS
jgi:arginase